MSDKRKLWEIADIAIRDDNSSMAKGLMQRLENRGLNYAGCREFLTEHGVDWNNFEDVLKGA